MEACQCFTCQKGREMNAVLKKKDPDEMVAMIQELGELWLCAEFDKGYCEAILDGSWPSAFGMRRSLESGPYSMSLTKE